MGYRYNPFTGDFDRIGDGTSGTGVETLTGNSGGAVSADGADNIDVLGDNTQGIDIVGVPASNSLTVSGIDATESQIGVVELATDAEAIAGSATTNLAIIPSSLKAKLGVQTAYAIPYGNGTTGAFGWSSSMTDGQLIVGATGSVPAATNLTSSGATVTITNGPNSINLETAATVPTQFDTDSGSAVPALGVLDILGGTGCSTSGATSVVTVNLDATVAISYPCDSGTATPAANALTLAGGTVAAGTTPVATLGAGATATVNVQTSQAIASTDATKIGLCNFNSAYFSVDANGFVSFIGPIALSWIDEGTGITLSENTGYFVTAAVTETLPAAPSQGDTVKIICDHAGPVVTANTGQTISLGNTSSSTAGTFTSTAIGDALDLYYRSSGAEWKAISAVGNWTIA